MKISELIEQLRQLPPECDVYIWLPLDDGFRVNIIDVDPRFVEYGFVDIDAKGQKK